LVKSKPHIGVLLSGGEKFSPYFGGAIARWTYEVYRRLSDDVDVTVYGVTTKEKDKYQLSHFDNLATLPLAIISKIPFVRRAGEMLWFLGMWHDLKRKDIIHVQNRPRWVSRLRRLGYQGKIILHMHNPHLGRENVEFLDRLAGEVDVVVTCSKYLASQFRSKSECLAKCSKVVYNGADIELFKPDSSMRRIGAVIYNGRLHPEKGVDVLLDAFEIVIRKLPYVTLTICGGSNFGSNEENDYIKSLHKKAESLNRIHSNAVTFTGYISHNELSELFQKSHLFVSPSRVDDSFPLAVIEAMAAGLPVIGTRRGGIPEAIGDGGLLVDKDNVDELAAVIELVISDKNLSEKLSKESLSRVHTMFTWDIIAEQWRNILLSDNSCNYN